MAAVSALGGLAEPESLKRLNFSWGSDVTIEIRDLRLRADRLEEMTGLKFLAGSVKKLLVTLTGGIFGVLKSKPISVEIDGLLILLGAFPDAKSDEGARKEAAAALLRDLKQRLELNAFLFRQKLSSILMETLGVSESGGKEGGMFSAERIINGVVTSGRVDIRRVHIRYEDTQLGKKPFAVGVTLAGFETKGAAPSASSTALTTPAAADAPPSLPHVPGLTYRDSRISHLALYWDPLVAPMEPLIPPPGSPQASWAAWEEGMIRAIAGVVPPSSPPPTSTSAAMLLPVPPPPAHCYILAPISPSASLAINLSKVRNQPTLRVALRAELLLALSPRQLAAANALGAFMGRQGATVALLKRYPPPTWAMDGALGSVVRGLPARGGAVDWVVKLGGVLREVGGSFSNTSGGGGGGGGKSPTASTISPSSSSSLSPQYLERMGVAMEEVKASLAFNRRMGLRRTLAAGHFLLLLKAKALGLTLPSTDAGATPVLAAIKIGRAHV